MARNFGNGTPGEKVSTKWDSRGTIINGIGFQDEQLSMEWDSRRESIDGIGCPGTISTERVRRVCTNRQRASCHVHTLLGLEINEENGVLGHCTYAITGSVVGENHQQQIFLL